MNEHGQGKYMDIGVTAGASKDEIEIEIENGFISRHVPESEPGWIRPSSSTNSLLGLPEMSLQRSISTEVELLDDIVVERQHIKEKGKDLDVEHEDAQSEVDASLFSQDAVMENNSSKGQGVDQIKRTRTAEVHNKSERTRRDKIKGKIKTLQELMPHCRKKDRASILDDAANYVKSLQLQVEMITKAREDELLAQYMSCVATLSMPPIRPGIGMAFRPSLCASCSTPCAQWMPCPPAAGVHHFAPSTHLSSFPFHTIYPTAVVPSDGSVAGETEQPEIGI